MEIKSAKLANFCWAQGVFTPDAWQINPRCEKTQTKLPLHGLYNRAGKKDGPSFTF